MNNGKHACTFSAPGQSIVWLFIGPCLTPHPCSKWPGLWRQMEQIPAHHKIMNKPCYNLATLGFQYKLSELFILWVRKIATQNIINTDRIGHKGGVHVRSLFNSSPPGQNGRHFWYKMVHCGIFDALWDLWDGSISHSVPHLNFQLSVFQICWSLSYQYLIFANERWCYIITSSLIGWVHTYNYPYITAADDLAMLDFYCKQWWHC